MLRWTVSLAVLVAMLASSTELMAQRRQPLRNLARQIGVRWSAGYHWQNPGHDPGYYSPWSSSNTPTWQHKGMNNQYIDGQIIPQGQIIMEGEAPVDVPQPTPAREPSDAVTPTPDDNSASRLLNQNQMYQNRNSIGANNYQNQTIRPATRPGVSSTISDNNRINQYLKPYHTNNTNQRIEVGGGGQFQIQSNQIPANNTGWNSRYDQQLQNSEQRIPGNR